LGVVAERSSALASNVVRTLLSGRVSRRRLPRQTIDFVACQ
jgi:hypothetical protein